MISANIGIGRPRIGPNTVWQNKTNWENME